MAFQPDLEEYCDASERVGCTSKNLFSAAGVHDILLRTCLMHG